MPWEEIPHTADWAIRVWAHDLPTLFRDALSGMYALCRARPAAAGLDAAPVLLQLAAVDTESLLVAFLSEALFHLEDGRLLEVVSLSITADRLEASVRRLPLAHAEKEIKAVTYHGLSVRRIPEGVEAMLVFDV